MPFRHVLVPTDFSDASREAGAWGAALALRLGASLTLLHVLDIPDWEWWGSLEGVPDDARSLQSGLLEEAREKLRAEAARIPGTEGLEVQVRARSGRPAREILGEARETGVDLVVVTTQGRTGLANALLGSVAEKLVRTCPCPLLTVKAGERPPRRELRDLLYATDLSDASRDALGPAGALASALGCRFTALHVLEEPRLSVGTFEDVFGLSVEEMQRRLEARARKAIRDQVEPALPEGLELHVKLVGGRGHEEILREARSGEHDLVVLGTHGRSNLAEALLGSTAERVVRTSPVPVLTVRSPG